SRGLKLPKPLWVKMAKATPGWVFSISATEEELPECVKWLCPNSRSAFRFFSTTSDRITEVALEARSATTDLQSDWPCTLFQSMGGSAATTRKRFCGGSF